jgi:acylphosphatase
LKAFTVIVFGDVQGVGFRRAVQREARKLAVVGHIKNRKDGSVEILAQCETSKLELLLNSIRALGPPISVQSIERTPAKVSNGRNYFEIIHGTMEEELDEGLGAGEAQLFLLRNGINTKFDVPATRYDSISGTLAKVVEESAQSREDFKKALDTLTTQTREFKDALVALTDLAKEYFDERRKEQTR